MKPVRIRSPTPKNHLAKINFSAKFSTKMSKLSENSLLFSRAFVPEKGAVERKDHHHGASQNTFPYPSKKG